MIRRLAAGLVEPVGGGLAAGRRRTNLCLICV
jgi:hypothetical protein